MLRSSDQIRAAVRREQGRDKKHSRERGELELGAVERDGSRLAVINRDQIEDGLIIVPGKNKVKLRLNI